MKSIVALPCDYVVIDLETTGRNPHQDEIMEIAAIKYRDNKEVARYSQLVKTVKPVSGFVFMLTGISSKMTAQKPTIDQVIGDFAEFVGDDILIGHNIAAFDSVFLQEAYEKHLGKPLENACVDTMRLAKKLFPGLESYSLGVVAEHLGLSYHEAHRGLADSETTNACYQSIRSTALSNGTLETFCDLFKKKSSADMIKEITATASAPTDHQLYGKNIVFTGSMLLTRAEAMQLAADCGAVLQKGVTTKTDYLIVGVQDLDRVGTDGMSLKEEKAARFNETGKANIQIITENDFLKMVKR